MSIIVPMNHLTATFGRHATASDIVLNISSQHGLFHPHFGWLNPQLLDKTCGQLHSTVLSKPQYIFNLPILMAIEIRLYPHIAWYIRLTVKRCWCYDTVFHYIYCLCFPLSLCISTTGSTRVWLVNLGCITITLGNLTWHWKIAMFNTDII